MVAGALQRRRAAGSATLFAGLNFGNFDLAAVAAVAREAGNFLKGRNIAFSAQHLVEGVLAINFTVGRGLLC